MSGSAPAKVKQVIQYIFDSLLFYPPPPPPNFVNPLDTIF
ncbi:hypothetical protein J2Z29_000017 [Treponema pedis]